MGLETVELVMAVEDEFGIQIADTDAPKLAVLGDMHAYIVRALADRGESPDETHVWERLSAVVVEQLGVRPVEVTRTAHIAYDFRCGLSQRGPASVLGYREVVGCELLTFSFGNRRQAGMKHWCIAVPLVLLLFGCEARSERPTSTREPPTVAAPPPPEVKQFEWGLGKIMVGMTKDEVLHQIKETWKRPNGDGFADQGVIVPGVSEPPPSTQEGDRWELRYGEGSGAAPGGGAITLIFEAERLIQIVVGMVSA